MATYDYKRIFDQIKEKVQSDRYQFHTPRGNSKLGMIPAFNLCPGYTCSPEACAHCMNDGCYAMKNMIRAGYDIDRNNVFRNWSDLTVMAVNHMDELETELNRYFDSPAAPRFFRIHSAGDFFRVDYAQMWFRIAEKHPHTNFLAFTKQWENVRPVPFWSLANFSLVLSGWTGVTIPDDLREHYRCAWCDDGTEDRIPSDALECPGNCDQCGLCWKLGEIGKDTYFHKH